jgi:small subunit ribosomal protein S3Ae
MAVKNKRPVDNWKKKKWFEVYADPVFDNKIIGQTIAIESKKIIGRKIRKNLKELTNSIRDSYYEVTFVIKKTTATKADTEISCFETKSNYLRRIVRRGKSKIEPVFYVITKDNRKLKLKILFITGARYPVSAKKEAQKIIVDAITKSIKTKMLTEAWNDIISQKLAENCRKPLKSLGYINKILISKATLKE